MTQVSSQLITQVKISDLSLVNSQPYLEDVQDGDDALLRLVAHPAACRRPRRGCRRRCRRLGRRGRRYGRALMETVKNTSIYRVFHQLADLGWVDFDVGFFPMPESAWADEIEAETAEQLGKIQ